MREQQQTFVAGAVNNGIDERLAREIFALIEPFAGYAFNKAHSVSYALVAYRGAFLKANYTVEYITAFMNTYWDNAEKVCLAAEECRRMGIPVLAPDVCSSDVGFTIEDLQSGPAIRFGLASIKNVGLGPVEAIVGARREGGPFASVMDFCRRVGTKEGSRKPHPCGRARRSRDAFKPSRVSRSYRLCGAVRAARPGLRADLHVRLTAGISGWDRAAT